MVALQTVRQANRLIVVKASILTSPLPRTMQFGKFIGRVFHFRQNKGLQEKKPVTASLTTKVSDVCSRYLYYLQF